MISHLFELDWCSMIAEISHRLRTPIEEWPVIVIGNFIANHDINRNRPALGIAHTLCDVQHDGRSSRLTKDVRLTFHVISKKGLSQHPAPDQNHSRGLWQRDTDFLAGNPEPQCGWLSWQTFKLHQCSPHPLLVALLLAVSEFKKCSCGFEQFRARPLRDLTVAQIQFVNALRINEARYQCLAQLLNLFQLDASSFKGWCFRSHIKRLRLQNPHGFHS